MTVSNLNFAGVVDDWTRKTEQRLTAVFRESAQRVASIAANGVPVDTGFARASVRASLSDMPAVVTGSKPAEGQAYPFEFGQITATIASAQMSDTVYIGWTASYIGKLEYGSSKQAPNGFVRLAAEQWQVIVNGVVQEAQSLARP